MRRPPPVIVVDFETFGIEARPHYPPVPVGVSIKHPGKKAIYYAWGHPVENNCTYGDAYAALQQVWQAKHPVLFHHCKFDVDVAQVHFPKLGALPAERIHDTMFLLFLLDPHAPDFKLKPSCERLLGVAPDEQDAVRDWILANKRSIPFEFTPSQWGAAIAYAPGKLVGKYANGDCDRTLALFNHCWPRVVERGMEEAYDRERALMPILLENERVGMRVALPALRRDIKLYSMAGETAEDWLRKRLKAPGLNLDSDAEVAEALSRAKIIDDTSWSLTATGKRSVSKKTLIPSMYKSAQVAAVFGYRNRLMTCLKTFMIPWERQATARPDGHISTNWNQVRQSSGGGLSGTRTGRPSCNNPNFLNLSKTWDDKDDGYEHPTACNLDSLPLVRKYILPDRGDIFCHRDYNGQELRILGHFEDGELMGAYQANPRLDIHDHVRYLIDSICGLSYQRSQVKITNFRRIYGGGAPATASALNVSIDAAKQLLAAHGRALPGVKSLSAQITALAKSGEPITTWGGRQYYPEPPKFDKKYGRHMTYEYKLLNYLIQGSAADVTKEAIIRYDKHASKNGRFLCTVYDEINVSAPKGCYKEEMVVLRECMEGIEMDVAMLSDGKTGPSWGDLTKYKD